jgi:(p)ppGpp synthase/HD superfamily hydrolase
MLTNRFDEALAYARAVHDGQIRKGTQTPYFSHLLAVAGIVLENGGSEDEAIAALLHDAAEDQGGAPRLANIRARFGPLVAEIVEACSDSLEEDPAKKPPWHERKKRYHDGLSRHQDTSAFLVSAADKLHNARAMAQDERQEGEKLWRRFNVGKGCVLWNLRTLAGIYGEQQDARVRNVAAELKRVIAELNDGRYSSA